MRPELSERQLLRYSRQMIMDGVGYDGQERLLQAHVGVIGAGGLGCPVLSCLIGAGVGTITICDPDRVALENLHRQTLYSVDDIDRKKVDCVHDVGDGLNPDVAIRRIDHAFDPERFPTDLDLVIDTTDQQHTRQESSRFAKAHATGYLTGAVQRFSALLFQQAHNGSCFSCAFPHPPDALLLSNCDRVGIFGPTTTALGGLLAQKALQMLLFDAKPEVSTLDLWDFEMMSVYAITVASPCHCCRSTPPTTLQTTPQSPPQSPPQSTPQSPPQSPPRRDASS